MKRLLIALPIAAVIVIALFWAMRELVPVGRTQAVYTVVIRSDGTPDCQNCVTVLTRSIPEHKLPPINGHDVPPPPPSPPPSKPVEPTEIPREKFPAPEANPDISYFPQTESGPCASRPIVRFAPIWPKHARHGDYAIVEFTLGADGIPSDIKVVESSNPKIHDDVVRIVRYWRFKPNCVDGKLVEKEHERRRLRIEFEKEGMEE